MTTSANDVGDCKFNKSDNESDLLKDNLTSLLSSFNISSGLSFRELMVHTGAVLSGSAALFLLQPGQFTPNDIDIYVLPDGIASVVIYVQQHGYVLQASQFSLSDYETNRLLVLKLVHPLYEKSINIVSAFENHVAKIITDFHSTLVMNYVSWFGVVCLYPAWTNEKRGLVLKTTKLAAKCCQKYEERGYTMSREVYSVTPGHVCGEDPYCPKTVRTLADGHTFVRLFEPEEDLFSRELPEYVSWSLGVPCNVHK